MLGPPARCIAPSTPPPPASPAFAALTIASACTFTISPCSSASVTPLIVRVDMIVSLQSVIYRYPLNVGARLAASNMHQPKKPAQDSVGARVVGMGREGIYGRPVLASASAGPQATV